MNKAQKLGNPCQIYLSESLRLEPPYYYYYYLVSYSSSICLSRLLFIQLNVQLDCSKKMLKLTLKFTLKCSYMFRFNNHHQGAYCCALLKL